MVGVKTEPDNILKGLTEEEIIERHKRLAKEYWESEKGIKHLAWVKKIAPKLDFYEYK